MDAAEFQTIIDRLNANDPTLTMLDLARQKLTAGQLVQLVGALEKNKTLTSLNLKDNKIGDAGAETLAKALATNKTLTSLNLWKNQIGDEGAIALAKALETNTTLTSLNLYDNKIGDKGAQALAKALETNKTLTSLNLWYNEIGAVGAQALANALATNETLTSLNLGYNQIDDAGAQALAKALETNTTLTSLNLSKNQIGVAGAQALANALKHHKNILEVWLDGNNPSTLGALLTENHRIARAYVAQLLDQNTPLNQATLGDLWERRFAIEHVLIKEHNHSAEQAKELIKAATAPSFAIQDQTPDEYYRVIKAGKLELVIDSFHETGNRFTPERLSYRRTPEEPRIIDLIAQQGKLDHVFNYEHMLGQHVAMHQLWDTLTHKQRERVPGYEAIADTLNAAVLHKEKEPTKEKTGSRHTNKKSVRNNIYYTVIIRQEIVNSTYGDRTR